MRQRFTIDWRDAWRSLRATPLVTAIAVLSLALGIGANTALFSILNSLVLKSLPVRDPQQLALLDEPSGPTRSGNRFARTSTSSPTARSPGRPTGSTCRRADRRTSSRASTPADGMFDVLGVSTVLGRDVHAGRRRAGRRAGRRRRGHQLRLLAAALRRRSGRHRPTLDDRARAVHDRRRSRHRDSSAPTSAARSTSPSRSVPSRLLRGAESCARRADRRGG